MKTLFLIALSLFSASRVMAQGKFFTKSGTISFNAGTAVEDVDAVNKSATSVFDAGTGQIEFAVLMKGFEFKRALMQEHFNENYVESEKYPKAVFKGSIQNISEVSFSKEGTYPATVVGIMDIHGVKKEITVPGVFVVAKGAVSATADFIVALEDYHISIPGAVADKISPTVKVHTDFLYKPLLAH
jgi:polyisoprenoid-binding protein YceI